MRDTADGCPSTVKRPRWSANPAPSIVVAASGCSPSGHATAAVAAEMPLVLATGPATRRAVAVVAGASAVAISAAAITAGWHYSSDVGTANLVVRPKQPVSPRA